MNSIASNNSINTDEIKIYKYDKQKYHIDFSDIKSIIRYVINHYEKFLLLLLILVMVYFIDHLTNVNATIYGATHIPLGATASGSSSSSKAKKPKPKRAK